MENNKLENGRSGRYGWFSATHFGVWLPAVAMFDVGDQLDRLFGLWILLIPVVAVPALIAVVTFFTGLIANIGRRRWSRLISVVAAPAKINPDWVRFQLTRGHYAKLVHDLPGPSPKHAKWNWGETGGATGAQIFYQLVYDEADKPLDRECNGSDCSARPYGHHFFLVTDIYQ
ncbi:hypothetical protein [Trinickia fusca]|uniref:Uncharacterized protein n=1 Tax=Trinickia fusca TaxID=2419777 RepID=A0A494WZD0_9BURK|nr:hypothetical protein [Trinickia fusca]RKP43402.1 hypothetical protein D7S89_26410 [Trinickia fusca]